MTILLLCIINFLSYSFKPLGGDKTWAIELVIKKNRLGLENLMNSSVLVYFISHILFLTMAVHQRTSFLLLIEHTEQLQANLHFLLAKCVFLHSNE